MKRRTRSQNGVAMFPPTRSATNVRRRETQRGLNGKGRCMVMVWGLVYRLVQTEKLGDKVEINVASKAREIRLSLWYEVVRSTRIE